MCEWTSLSTTVLFLFKYHSVESDQLPIVNEYQLTQLNMNLFVTFYYIYIDVGSQPEVVSSTNELALALRLQLLTETKVLVQTSYLSKLSTSSRN